MAVPRKRKASPESSPPDHLDAHDLLRRHFEARFQPLDQQASSKSTTPLQHQHQPEQSDEDQHSEWAGLSDEDGLDEEQPSDQASHDEESQTIEVVDYSKRQVSKEPAMTKRQLKAFMSSRPPDHTIPNPPATPTHPTPSKPSSLPEDAPSLLKQDLQLRRLLAESHLLAPHAPSAKSLSSLSVQQASQPKPFAEGRTRRKTTDLRVQALGSRLSIHKQDRMPMQMRKGMEAAAQAREAKRRREARENGIILERETGKKKRRRGGSGRDAGAAVDRPGVGRLRGAELRISEREVRGIEGVRDVFGRRGNSRR
ncbi:hypothetical protein E4U55_000171 [Claviceps digitariae]|nr:hypothetical protein E4U55_000171 [Claviceps digitariae]